MSASPSHSIERAQCLVRQSLQRWNAADLENVEQSRKLLEQAVPALRTAIDLLRKGDAGMTRGLQPAIASLRRDISTMIRLVDACSAFRRGLALRTDGALTNYDASGNTVGAADTQPVHGVMG